MTNSGSSVCLIEGCERKVITRGLCHPCYQLAFKCVRRGDATWEQLVVAGLALEAQATSFTATSPFTSALKKQLQAGLEKPKAELTEDCEGSEVERDAYVRANPSDVPDAGIPPAPDELADRQDARARRDFPDNRPPMPPAPPEKGPGPLPEKAEFFLTSDEGPDVELGTYEREPDGPEKVSPGDPDKATEAYQKGVADMCRQRASEQLPEKMTPELEEYAVFRARNGLQCLSLGEMRDSLARIEKSKAEGKLGAPAPEEMFPDIPSDPQVKKVDSVPEDFTESPGLPKGQAIEVPAPEETEIIPEEEAAFERRREQMEDYERGVQENSFKSPEETEITPEERLAAAEAVRQAKTHDLMQIPEVRAVREDLLREEAEKNASEYDEFNAKHRLPLSEGPSEEEIEEQEKLTEEEMAAPSGAESSDMPGSFTEEDLIEEKRKFDKLRTENKLTEEEMAQLRKEEKEPRRDLIAGDPSFQAEEKEFLEKSECVPLTEEEMAELRKQEDETWRQGTDVPDEE